MLTTTDLSQDRVPMAYLLLNALAGNAEAEAVRRRADVPCDTDRNVPRKRQSTKAITMRLDSLTVVIQSRTADTVTFTFTTKARLSATDEANVSWGLWVDLYGLGWTKLSGTWLLPDAKGDHRYAGDPVKPTGKKQGDSWAPSFTQTYQRNVIAVDSGDQYNFYAKLVPVTSINASAEVVTTLVTDL